MKIKIHKKYKIYIWEAEPENSTWFKRYDNNFFKIQGKIFKRMILNKKYKLFCIQFAIRKYFLYRKYVSFKQALKNMLEQK